jgi:glycosyltransferase involved in cell wall biosynthesis
MRIAINTLAMKRELYGVGNYIKNLVWALAGIDRENEYVLFASAENTCHLKGIADNFSLELAPSNRMLRLPWEQSVLPLRLKQKRIDVYHGATFVTPLLKNCEHVVSIHDMTFHLLPERHSLHKRLYFQSMIPAAVLRSDRVIAISESTKCDLLRFIPTDAGKINVVHHGVEPRFRPVREKNRLDDVREKYGLGRRFILFVGLIEPRKNLENLVDAYESSGLGKDFDLVLAGNLGWDYSGLLRKIESSQFREKIRLPGYIADGDLPALFSMAAAFVYPSVYEGFGLPVLEAMACGTPVITSQASSLPEVAGDAAILVDPFDPKALASALQIVLADEDLRRSLSERGIQRAQFFTWEKTAQKTLEAYKGRRDQGK